MRSLVFVPVVLALALFGPDSVCGFPQNYDYYGDDALCIGCMGYSAGGSVPIGNSAAVRSPETFSVVLTFHLAMTLLDFRANLEPYYQRIRYTDYPHIYYDVIVVNVVATVVATARADYRGKITVAI